MIKMYKAKYLSLISSTVTGETGEQQSNISAVMGGQQACVCVCVCTYTHRERGAETT